MSSIQYLTEEQAKSSEERVKDCWGDYGQPRPNVCVCPKCDTVLPRISGQKCGFCPRCGTQMRQNKQY